MLNQILPAIFGERLQEKSSDFNSAREQVLDHLETAICDADGKRFKERDIVTSMKTIKRLP